MISIGDRTCERARAEPVREQGKFFPSVFPKKDFPDHRLVLHNLVHSSLMSVPPGAEDTHVAGAERCGAPRECPILKNDYSVHLEQHLNSKKDASLALQKREVSTRVSVVAGNAPGGLLPPAARAPPHEGFSVHYQDRFHIENVAPRDGQVLMFPPWSSTLLLKGGDEAKLNDASTFPFRMKISREQKKGKKVVLSVGTYFFICTCRTSRAWIPK
jgi:hypothetical protein